MKQVVVSPEKSRWQRPIDIEMTGPTDSRVSEQVPLLAESRILKTKMLPKRKANEHRDVCDDVHISSRGQGCPQVKWLHFFA